MVELAESLMRLLWSGSSKVSRLLGLNGLGISRGGCSHSARKRYWSRQKVVMANLRSLDAIYRQVLAPKKRYDA